MTRLKINPMRSSITITIALAAALVTMMWLDTPPRAEESGSAEIVVIRGDTHCPGIPGLDVRLDGGAPAILGAKEYLRLKVAPGTHALVFYPAIPENVSVDAVDGSRQAFVARAIRLGWRCKFEISQVTGYGLVQALGTSAEVPLATAQTPGRPLAENRGQMILRQP